MNSNRTPILLFLLILISGLAGYEAYQWWRPRRELNAVREAQRNLHIAVEEYFLRYNEYPMAVDKQGKEVKKTEGYTLGRAPWKLLSTKPSSRRLVPLAKQTYYCSDRKTSWILAFPGPDGRLDVDLKAWIKNARGNRKRYLEIHPEGLLEYDPANGALSRGDILRTGP